MERPTQSEIIICGGSLAGLSAAIRLRQLGHSPLVFEKSVFPRGKLCGEFLGPDALPALEKLGLLESVLSEAYGPVEEVFFHSQQGQTIRIPLAWMHQTFPYGLAIPRERLDTLMLAQSRQSGIEVLEKHRVANPLEKESGQFAVQVQSDSRMQCYQAPVLLDASGRHGHLKIRGQVFNAPTTQQTQVGVQCHLHLPLSDPALHMFLFPGGYGGIQPLSSQQANLCLLMPALQAGKIRENFQQVINATLGQNPLAKPYIENLQLAGPIHTTAQLNLYPNPSGLMQIGDARITVDPFTGSGMAQALETGLLAAEVIHAGLEAGASYEAIHRQYEKRYHSIYGWRLQALRLFRPCLFSLQAQRFLWPLLEQFSPQLSAVFR